MPDELASRPIYTYSVSKAFNLSVQRAIATHRKKRKKTDFCLNPYVLNVFTVIIE